MSENESAKAYLEKRKAVVGRLQGQHQVPGSTSKTLAQVKDKYILRGPDACHKARSLFRI